MASANARCSLASRRATESILAWILNVNKEQRLQCRHGITSHEQSLETLSMGAHFLPFVLLVRDSLGNFGFEALSFKLYSQCPSFQQIGFLDSCLSLSLEFVDLLNAKNQPHTAVCCH